MGNPITYDATGNVTTRVEGGVTYIQNFDAENRLISVNVTGQSEPSCSAMISDLAEL